ncbi:MAG: single-stranded DNA-binding protein [Bacteroidota bacterium]|nr:single-stranded DNA-binding protein [Bacteroidota bacterium]
MINKVILLGNIGKDPDVNYIQPDVAVAKFPLATDESFKRKDGEWENRSTWHKIVTWRYTAQYAEKNIRKGQLVYVEGKIQTRKYEDKNGQERYITEIVAHTVRILNKRDGTDSNSSNTPQENTQSNNAVQYDKPKNESNPVENEDPFTADDGAEDDGLPF